MKGIESFIKKLKEQSYTTEYLEDGGAIAPLICTISLVNLKTKEVYTFAVLDFDKRDFNLVQLSTQRKALGILDLFEKYICLVYT